MSGVAELCHEVTTQLFLSLFGRWLRFHYQCFDRIVINGYLRFLFQEGCVITFFHHICGVARITKEVLRARSDDYNRWVAAYAVNHGVPLVWATPGERKEEVVRPFLQRRKRAERFGLYYVMMSQERGPSFRIAPPRFPTADPDHMLLRAQRSRYRHYYFYIYDEVLGAMLLRVGSFVPFAVTAYINGHEFIARRMQKQGIGYTQPDNCFTVVGDHDALQAAADAFSAELIQERIDYWSFHLGPKFSKKERMACGGLRRFWSLQQIEYCHQLCLQAPPPNPLPV